MALIISLVDTVSGNAWQHNQWQLKNHKLTRLLKTLDTQGPLHSAGCNTFQRNQHFMSSGSDNRIKCYIQSTGTDRRMPHLSGMFNCTISSVMLRLLDWLLSLSVSFAQ